VQELTVFPLPGGTYWKSSPYGWRTHPVTGVRKLHRGTDYAAPAETPVYAPFDGVVTTGYEAGGAGHWSNLSANGVVFKSFHHPRPGRSGAVKAGEEIARIGTSGSSTGPHGHFELWVNGTNIDPTPYLDRAPLKGATVAETHVRPLTIEEDEDVTVICWDDQGAYACNGLLKRPVANEAELNAYRYIGCKDIGKNPAFLALLTELPRTRIEGQ